jgi:polyferredoxin
MYSRYHWRLDVVVQGYALFQVRALCELICPTGAIQRIAVKPHLQKYSYLSNFGFGV